MNKHYNIENLHIDSPKIVEHFDKSEPEILNLADSLEYQKQFMTLDQP